MSFPKKGKPVFDQDRTPNPNKFQRKSNYHNELKKRALEGNDDRRGFKKFRPDYREEDFKKPGNFGKKEPNVAKFSKFNKNRAMKPGQKGPPKKGSSQDYINLSVDGADGRSDDEVPDVSDMFEGEDNTIPLLNAVARKSQRPFSNPEAETTITSPVSEPAKKKKKKLKKKKAAPVVVEESESDFEEELKNHDAMHGEPEEVDEEDQAEEERKRLREELANMPIGQVKAMKDKLGIKLFNKTYFGVQKKVQEEDKKKQEAMEERNEARGQHRPKEISSKRPVSAFRNIYAQHELAPKKKRWDPRFDERAGDFNEGLFDEKYSFLNELREEEKKELKSELKSSEKEGDGRKVGKIKMALHRLETKEKTQKEKQMRAKIRNNLKEENIERMLRGEAPVYKTKGDLRKMELESKFDQLKKEKRLDKYLQKKAKKSSAKEKKSRPRI